MARTMLTFWGVRGSMASPSRKTVIYGGNTACVEIETEKTRVICDAGTGIRPLGIDLIRRIKGKPLGATIILSHLHWDHYIGLPFFGPFYNGNNHFTIAGPKAGKLKFGDALTKVVNPPYFPVPFSDIPASITFKTLSPGQFKIGDVRVSAMEMNHPNGSLGWRFFFPNKKSIVHITDNEPVSGKQLRNLIDWMKDADILIHDAQYTPENYRYHNGWGHSPFTYSLMLAREARVKKLFLFHFDPGASDSDMKKVLIEARRLMRESHAKFTCNLAREGLSILI